MLATEGVAGGGRRATVMDSNDIRWWWLVMAVGGLFLRGCVFLNVLVLSVYVKEKLIERK